MDARYSDDILPKNIKKVELHVHQDTCLSLHYIKQVCPGITLEDFTRIFIAPTKFGDLALFLRKVALWRISIAVANTHWKPALLTMKPNNE